MSNKVFTSLFFLLSLQLLQLNGFGQESKKLIKASQDFLELQKQKKSVEHLVELFAKTSIEEIISEVNTNDKKLAFWVNVYNGFIQYTLAKNPTLYEDRRGFFNEKRISIAGEVLSFSNIEHGIIRKSQSPIGAGYIRRIFRPRWERKLRVDKKDWRVHFALNCGAKSCPPVATYSPEMLNAEFDFMTRSYLEEQTTYEENSRVASTVSLFSWFRGDFGGKRGARKILRDYNITNTKPKKLSFTKYDWTLLLGNYREIVYEIE